MVSQQLSACASALAIAVASICGVSSANAQSASDAASPTAGPPADRAADARTTGGIEDIVVTGQRRSEKFINAPVAVSVFTEAEISRAGINRPADFLKLTPNVSFIEGGNSAGDSFINIRGQTAVRNSDANVAVIIDGVQLSVQQEFNADLVDISQIEVLKGPQSALYGRNAAAGAIVIATRPPSDQLNGSVVAEYGSWNSARIVGALGGPLTDTLSFRVAAALRDTDGPYQSITSGENVQRRTVKTGQLRLDWRPVDNLSFDFRVSGTHSEGGALNYNTQLVGLPIGGVPVPVLDTNQTDLPYVSNVISRNVQKRASASLKVDYETSIGTFTSVTAYSKLNDVYGGDGIPYIPDTGAPGAFTQKYGLKNSAFTQEARFSSKSDSRIRWMVGAYYLRANSSNRNINGQDLAGAILPGFAINGAGTSNPTMTASNSEQRTENFAPFANIQFDLLPQLTVDIAGRYDTERRRRREVEPDVPSPVTGVSLNQCVAVLSIPASQCVASTKFSKFQPKASLTYKVPSLGSVYVTYGEGFKSGGVNPIGTRQVLINGAASIGLPASSVFVRDVFGPETSKSIEAGFKSQFFNRRLSINGSIFQTDIKNSQQFEFFPSGGIQAISTIDKIRIKGIEGDFRAQLTDSLQVYGGAGYLDAKVEKFAANPAFEGNRAPLSTKYNINLGAQGTFRLSDRWQLLPRIDYTRYGPIWYDVQNTPGTRRNPIDLVDARIGLESDNIQIALWARNLTNTHYNTEAVPLLGFFQVVYKGLPRSFGAELRYSF